MKRLTILVPDGQVDLSTLACIAGVSDVFTGANSHWKQNNRNELFKIELAGTSPTTEFFNGLVTVRPGIKISDIKKTDLIIIPSTKIRTYEKAGKGNQQLIDWIGKQYKEGAEIASICTGGFILASTGLLDGKTCSTHWASTNDFKAQFPLVNLQTEKLITDENGIYTNGGGYSFLNFMIYLVEKYYGRETAIYCSKIFQIEMDRPDQLVFSIFTGQRRHGDEMVKKAQTYIESNLTEKISVEQLSSKYAVSRRNFDRRFIKATGNTPIEYLQRAKIESAKKAFETTRKNINEIMYEVGYLDMKAFRDVFRKFTGVSPLEYRRKYNKEAMFT
jgi:transcriptional regulator GlxA family with amidase domain